MLTLWTCGKSGRHLQHRNFPATATHKKVGGPPINSHFLRKTLFHAFLVPRPPQFRPQDKLTPCPIAFQFVIMPLARWRCFFFTLSLGALLIEVVIRGVVVCFNLE
ncbi:hypothetical protein CDAR_51111 [Caerostris darwini]|uniref:Uncharacterized protein n=1 Tax=Caerostris darwini TaxID=1538125 RepID=A0AAV4U5X4_9ARAC|nr:hypothetical protein CDAR_51111 [Caerostris darwini]